MSAQFEFSGGNSKEFILKYKKIVHIAQLVEHLTVNQKVAGSSPAVGANN